MVDCPITLVVPTYNGATLLPDLLPGIKSQEEEFHSIIFIDDCSRDNSLQVASDFGFERAVFISNEQNLGLYGTLNKAISLVESEFVAFVFQDDLIFDGYAKEMTDVIRRRPDASFFVARSIPVSADGAPHSAPEVTGREWSSAKGSDSANQVLLKGTSWIISGSVSRTSSLRRYGFNPKLPQCGDFELFARAVRDEIFVYLDKTLVGIRNHAEQASVSNVRNSIDLIERIGILSEHVRARPHEISAALRLQLAALYLYYIFRRSAGQLRRGRVGIAATTGALSVDLFGALWPTTT